MKELNKITLIALCLFFTSLLPLNAQVVINEVMPKPFDKFTPCHQAMFGTIDGEDDYSGCGREWVELYNPSECLFADISCYILASNTGPSVSSGSLVFPEGTLIPPMGFLVVGGPEATNVDIVVEDYENTDNFCSSNRWFLENTDGWIGLFEPDGNPVNAIYWTFSANQAFKLNTESEYNFTPCLPDEGCLETTSLPKAKDIDNIVYIGKVSDTDLSIRRTIDGGDTWENDGTPTAGACNDAANCGVPTPFDVDLSTTNPTCDNTDGSANASVTVGNIAPIAYSWSSDGSNTTNSISDLGGGDYTLIVTNSDGCEYTEDFTLADATTPPTPDNPINSKTCLGAAPVAVSVNDPGTGIEVRWYATETGGTVLATGVSFTPPSTGSYYAEFVEIESGSECTSPRTEVTANEYEAITITEGDSNCSNDLSTFDLSISIAGGSGTYTLVEANGLTITDDGGGNYTIEAIPANTSVAVNVEDDAGCTGSLSVGNVDCSCPTLDAPQNPQDATYCAGENLAAIAVDAPTDSEQEIIWYDAETGGTQVAKGTSFTPTAAGTYYAVVSPTANDCESPRTAVTLSELPPIIITENSSACSLDLLTYEIVVTIAGGNGNYTNIDAEGVPITDNLNGTYTVSGIATGTNITIEVEDEEGCTGNASFNAPDCDCPDIAAPTGLENQTICNGENFAAFNADDVNGGFTIHWFDTASGGTELGTGTSFTPTSAGIYYAEVQEDASDCPSDRVAVEAIELTAITITNDDSNCSTGLTTYTIEVSLSGGNGNYSVSTDLGNVIENDNNTFTITDIPANTSVAIEAIDDLNCTTSTSFNAPDCDCPDVPAPTGLEDQTICNGEDFAAFNADDVGVGFTIHWFDAPNDGTELETGTSFTPTSAGTYYTEIQEDASDCPSERVAVEAIELSEIIIIEEVSVCSQDLTEYYLDIKIVGGNGEYTLVISEGNLVTIDANNFLINNIPTNVSLVIDITDNLNCDASYIFNPLDCDCPSITPPTGLSNQTICNGADFAPFSPDIVGAEFTVHWFDAPIEGIELGTGLFTPSTAGTYYAGIQEDVSGCSGDRISVEAIELEEITILYENANCSADLTTYMVDVTISGGNGNYSIETNEGTVVDNGGETYMVSDIPVDSNLSITATDDLDCEGISTFTAPNCDCPDVTEPTGLENQTICDGADFPTFTANDAGAGFTIYWYDAPNAGNELGTGTSFTPTTVGTYYVEIREDESDCSSDRIAVEAIELEAIEIVNNGTTCAENLQTYSITVIVENGTAPYTFDANGLTFTNSGENTFTIENVPSGTAATANVTDSNDCSASLELPAINCDCPAILPPTNSVDNSFCFGGSPTSLSIDAPAAGFEVQWYNSEFGGNVIASGVNFTPSAAGTYWAEIVEITSNCSSDRVSATLTEESQVSIEVISDFNCSVDLSSYDFQVFVSGGAGNYNLSAEGNSVVQNSSNNFSVSGVVSGSTTNIEVVDGNDCSQTITVGPFECNCPVLAAPTNPTPNDFCFGETPTSISVANPSTGLTINWYDAAIGGNLLETGSSFTPSMAGSYYAETTDENACVSERIEVILSELPQIIVNQVGFNCSADLSTYDLTINVSGGSGGFDFEVGGLTVSEMGGGNFTIQGIAANTDLNLTATDIEGCSVDASFDAPQCDCPDIAAPTNPQNAEVCKGETASISVNNTPAGFSINWFDAPFGGSLVSSSNSFTPSMAGTYYAQIVEDASGCRSEMVEVELSELPPITIIQGASLCSEDLQSYTATLTVLGGSGNGYTLTTSSGTIVDNGFGNFQITNIAAGEAIAVTAMDSEGCENDLSLVAKVCNCDPVNPPTNPQPATFCFGTTPNQVISVANPQAGFGVNWFDTPFGGNLVSSSSGFVPSSAGTYYAEIVDNVTNCTSSRIPVALTQSEPIVIEEGGKACSADLTTYDLNVQLSGGEGSLTLTSSGFVVANNGLGNFTVRDIPAGTNVSVTARDVNGCEEVASFEAPNCDCPTVNPPVQPTDNVFCFGENPTSISVAAPFTGFSVRWYATPFGGTVLSTNPIFTPSTAGTYYAEIVENGSGCTSSRIAVTLEELPQMTLIQGVSSCSTDLTTYDLTVTVNGGSGGLELTADGLEVVQNSANIFTIRSIPSGTAASATVRDTEGCITMADFEAVNCDCEVVNPPNNPQSNVFCFGGSPTPIAVNAAPSGFGIRWFDAPFGGNVVGTGASILPPSAGTYYAEMVETASACVSSRIEVELTEGMPIVVTQGNSDCSADLTTYNIDVNVSGGAGNFSLDAAPYSVQNNGGGSFTIVGIEANNSVSLVATDGNACSETAIFEAPVCDCAEDIASPTGASDNSYCADENPTVISVDAPPVGYNVRWYDAEFGGNLVSNETSFIPLMGGIYYAELEQVGSGCTSTPRTAVTLTQFPEIVITEGGATCSADLSTFDLEVNVSGGTGIVTFSAGGQAIDDLGDGNYVIRSVPVGSIVLSMATDEVGCNVQELLGPIDCDCDVVPLPSNPQNNAICFGETSAPISVDFPGAGFDIRWFTSEVGGFSVGSGAVFTPTAAGTYYAETFESGSACKSEGRVAVTLSENPEITLLETGSNCSADGTTYDLSFSLNGGTGAFSINAGTATVNDNGGGNYELVGIEEGTSISISATDEAGCSVNAIFGPVQCDCPAVNPPTGATNNSFCSDETPTPISVDAAIAGFEVRWYDVQTGGSSLATGASFTPSTAGTYFAEIIDLIGECASERVAVTLTALDCTETCTPPDAPVPVSPQSAVTCSGEPVDFVLTALANTLIKWYDAPQNGNLLATGASYLTDEPGSYFAVAVNESDSTCISSPTAFNLSLQIPAESSFTATTSDGCVGEEIEFSLASGLQENISYIWTFIDTESGEAIAEHIGAEPFAMIFDSTGMYDVELLAVSNDPAVCDGSTNLSLTISDMEVQTIEDLTIGLGESVDIPAEISATIGENIQYTWSASTDELLCDNCEVLIASPLQNTNYSVIVTDEYGCTSVAEVSVRVESNERAMVPNAFSPNEDGVNDRFFVVGQNIAEIDFQIYNRFGERIFQTAILEDAWDGTYKNRKMDIGVYPYYVLVTYLSGKQDLLRGNVTLIR